MMGRFGFLKEIIMKKSFLLLFLSMILYWSCEEEVEKDTTPPTVSITSHEPGQFVSEIITITATSEDDDGVSKVEFYLNTALVETDTIVPYEYSLNTTDYDNGQSLTIKAISYDNSDNTAEVQIDLSVDNTTAVPQGGNIISVTYDLESMTVVWEASTDEDFKNYKVLYSTTEDGGKDTIGTYTDKTITYHTITEFDPVIENWFWIRVMDTLGLSSIGIGISNEIESPPAPLVLYPIIWDDGSQISWSQNNDDDFQSYKIYESQSQDMSNQTLIYETGERTDTTYFITTIGHYQITSEDVWGLESTSNIEVGDYYVELWGESFSALYTIELILHGYELTGSIPSEIGNLVNLKSLDLFDNEFTGSIPPEIGNLINLTELFLHSNPGLTGSIPPQIGNLVNLTTLDLRGNELTGSIPSEIGNLTNLTYLNLSGNELTGFIPSEIWNLTNLNYIILHSNELTGSLPSEIRNLTNLKNFILHGNELTGSLPSEIGNLVNLYILDLRENQFTGSIPSEIWNLTNLNYLLLGAGNQLTGSIPSEIGNLFNLTGLDLTGNELTGSIPSEIGNLTKLGGLGLASNQLTGSLPSEIGNLTKLESLYLHNNQFSGSIPSEIGDLTNLEILELNNNHLSGPIPSEIENLTNLERLFLHYNQLTDQIPESICSIFESLGAYNFSGNQLCPPYPSCIEGYVGEQDTSDCD